MVFLFLVRNDIIFKRGKRKMKSRFLLALLVPLFLVGCDKSNGGNNNPDPKDTFEFTVDFTTMQTVNGGNATQFVDVIKSGFVYEESNLVNGLDYTGYAQINTAEQKTATATWNETALVIGNQNGMGKLDFTFNKKLVSVQFIARAHIKLYSYNSSGTQVSGISADQNPVLYVNNETWNLPTPTADDYTVQYKTFNVNSNRLAISTKDEAKQRVWIFSANFVFEK